MATSELDTRIWNPDTGIFTQRRPYAASPPKKKLESLAKGAAAGLKLVVNQGEPLSHAALLAVALGPHKDSISVMHTAAVRPRSEPWKLVDDPEQTFEDVPVLLNADGTVLERDPRLVVAMLAGSELLAGAEYADLARADLADDMDRVGLAMKQDAYETALEHVTARLDALDALLDGQRFLSGTETPSAADLVLYAVLARYDVVYATLFKVTTVDLDDLRNLGQYARDMHQWPGIVDVVPIEAAKDYYFRSHLEVDPKGIVPASMPQLFRMHDRLLRFPAVHTSSTATGEVKKSGAKGEFMRPDSKFRGRVGSAEFPAESGRYALIVAFNCPWCHRVTIMHALKNLAAHVSLDVVYYRRDPDRGWQYNADVDGCTTNTINDFTYVPEFYESLGSKERSVPILWDRKTGTIVNNESSELVRMLNSAFDDLDGVRTDIDFAPPAKMDEIAALNAYVYQRINNGAYKAGFSSNQAVHERACDAYFQALASLNDLLATRPFLAGDAMTEADVRLLPTIYRHDPVYFARMKLSKGKIARDFAHIQQWLERMLAAVPPHANNLTHCRNGYFGRTGNGIVPAPNRNAPPTSK